MQCVQVFLVTHSIVFAANYWICVVVHFQIGQMIVRDK